MTNALPSYVILATAALAAYAAASALYVANLYRPSPTAGRLAGGLAAAGALANFVALYSRAAALHSVPYRDLLGSMSLFGFFLAALNVVLEVRHRDRALGPFLVPAAFGMLLVSLLLPPGAATPRPELRGSIFALHVTLNMLAYAAFAVACALSALYLVARRWLRDLSRQGFDRPASRLPSLDFLVRANRTSLGLGVVSLFVGVGLGLVWAARMWGAEYPGWALDPKIATALVTLVFYTAVVVWAHRGAAPVTIARLSVFGFLLVLVSYTAINLLFSRVHAFT